MQENPSYPTSNTMKMNAHPPANDQGHEGGPLSLLYYSDTDRQIFRRYHFRTLTPPSVSLPVPSLVKGEGLY